MMPTNYRRGIYSSIIHITEDLQQIKRRRKIVRLYYADNDKSVVATCLQRLKQAVDSFMVGDRRTKSSSDHVLNATAGGKCGHVGHLSSGACHQRTNSFWSVCLMYAQEMRSEIRGDLGSTRDAVHGEAEATRRAVHVESEATRHALHVMTQVRRCCSPWMSYSVLTGLIGRQ